FAPPGPGAAADLVALEPDREGAPVRVRGVVVGGRAVVEGGRLLTGDLEAIREEARSQAVRLWGRMAAL
ncbi:MAG: hypothetical protein HY722_00350, partial [Planctomycetes bacterium]|nr:hypothetical protein [Planctomycetota bacterium]